MKKHNLPDESFLNLYNNISVNMANTNDIDGARKYLNKVIAIRPSILDECSYTGALINGNLGYVALLEDDADKAATFTAKSLSILEAIGSEKTADYISIMHNLSLAYEKQGRYNEAIKMYKRIYELYDADSMDVDGKKMLSINQCHLRVLTVMGKLPAVKELVKEHDKNNIQKFGRYSILRIEFIVSVGTHLKEAGDDYCLNLYYEAKDAIERAGLNGTLHHALVLNYIGVAVGDLYGHLGSALNNFEASKKIFEDIGMTENESYQTVLSNINYAHGLLTKKAMEVIAASMEENGSNDNN